MAIDRLIGFPSAVKVTTGDGWIDGVDPAEVLVLLLAETVDDVSTIEQFTFTEDGTLTVNAVSNRLKLRVRHRGGGPFNTPAAFVSVPNGPVAFGEAFVNGQYNPPLADYSFLEIWNGGLTNGYVNRNAGSFVNAVTGSAAYNPDIFSSMAAALDQDLNIVNGETNVPNSTGEVDLGSVAVGADAPTVTLTLENTGDLALTLDALTFTAGDTAKFSVASGSTWDGTADTEVAAAADTSVTLELDTSEAGEFEATVSIASDDPASPYTFTVIGTVQAESTTPPIELSLSLGLGLGL